MRGQGVEAKAIAERRRKIFYMFTILKMRSVDVIAAKLGISPRTVDRDLARIREELLIDTRTRIVAENYLTESLAEKDWVIQEAVRIYTAPPAKMVVKDQIIEQDASFRKLAALSEITKSSHAKDRLLGFTAPKQVERLTTILKQGGDIQVIQIERLGFVDRLNTRVEGLLGDAGTAAAQGYG